MVVKNFELSSPWKVNSGSIVFMILNLRKFVYDVYRFTVYHKTSDSAGSFSVFLCSFFVKDLAFVREIMIFIENVLIEWVTRILNYVGPSPPAIDLNYKKCMHTDISFKLLYVYIVFSYVNK